jgi:hypothetical protein
LRGLKRCCEKRWETLGETRGISGNDGEGLASRLS